MADKIPANNLTQYYFDHTWDPEHIRSTPQKYATLKISPKKNQKCGLTVQNKYNVI